MGPTTEQFSNKISIPLYNPARKSIKCKPRGNGFNSKSGIEDMEIHLESIPEGFYCTMQGESPQSVVRACLRKCWCRGPGGQAAVVAAVHARYLLLFQDDKVLPTLPTPHE